MVIRLWIAVAVLIAYGSFFPFDFRPRDIDPALIRAFVASCCNHSHHPNDILGNIILFFPFGFLGVVAGWQSKPLARRIAYVTILGGAFALATQLAQLYLPSRDANMQDALWNLSGVWAGILVGVGCRGYVARFTRDANRPHVVPVILIFSWIVFRLLPLIPSLNTEAILGSFDPLFVRPALDPMTLFHDAVAWLIVAYLLKHARPHDRWSNWLPALIVVVFALEAVIVANAVTASAVAGALIAVVLWWGIVSRLGKSQVIVLLILLIAMLFAAGLYPFIPSPRPLPFSWLPFESFLDGSIFGNALSASRKVFVYGSLVYLVWQLNLRLVWSIPLAIVPVALLEYLQIHYLGHVPEVTDPLVALVAVFIVSGFHRGGAAFSRSSQPDAAPSRAPFSR